MRFYLRAIFYFRKDWPLIGLLLLLIGLSVVVGLLQAWPTAVLMDAVLTHTPKRERVHRLFLAPLPDNKIAQVIGVTLIGMLLKITQDGIGAARTMINFRLKYNGVKRVRSQMYGKLQDLDAGYHRARPQGDSIYRLSHDSFGPFGVLDTFISTAVAAVMLTAMVCTMLSWNVRLTIYALSITPLMIATNLYFGRKIRKCSAESKQTDADFTTVAQRGISCIGLIQAFGRQKDSSAKFGAAVDKSARAWMRLNWQEQLYPLTVNFIYALGGAIIFGYGGYLVYRDQFANPVADGVTIGLLTVFMGYLGGLWDPLKALTGFSAAIQGHAAGTARVFDVLDRESAVADAPDAEPLPVRPRTLELDDVQFAYGEGAPVLRGASARIHPGEMVAFIGPSGTGKSTLLSLLSRFYNPTGGALRLDGRDLRGLLAADVRRHVALVLQDSPMLAATIAENIAFGRPDATPAQIRAAAEMAGAADFIELLPDRYDTAIDEGGQNFSGGQRQRLAIARALLTEAPILVLDEPTSALDPQSEDLVMSTLHGLKGRRTVVLVTHRLGSLRGCDQIFVMERGRVVQSGTHNELLSCEGFYRSRVRLHVAGEAEGVGRVRAAA